MDQSRSQKTCCGHWDLLDGTNIPRAVGVVATNWEKEVMMFDAVGKFLAATRVHLRQKLALGVKPFWVSAGAGSGSGMSTITFFSQCHFWSLIGR